MKPEFIGLIVGAIVLWGLWAYLTRNKCTKCKSRNFVEVDRQHIKSYQKRTRVSGGNNHGQLIVTQYDEYKVSYECNDCRNIWIKRLKESEEL